MRAMWIGTETAQRLAIGNEFFDRKPSHVTPPGASFLRNSEGLYGLWFFAINNHLYWVQQEHGLELGMPDQDGMRTFQGRAALGSLRTTSYWLTAILVTLIETYTKDLLTFVAARDPGLFGDLGASLSPRQVARKWVQRRKAPREWLEGFGLLGVNGFSPDTDQVLYELLGVRHLVVHSAGIVDEGYLEHHPSSGWTLGSEARIDEAMLHTFIRATFDFFAPIEAHFVARFVH